MNFTLTKASDWDFEETIEIKDMEELKSLHEKFNRRFDFVIDFNEMTIIIYDSWLE